MKKLLLIIIIIGIDLSGLQALSVVPPPRCDSGKMECTVAKPVIKQKKILPVKKAATSEFNFFIGPFIKLYQLITPHQKPNHD